MSAYQAKGYYDLVRYHGPAENRWINSLRRAFARLAAWSIQRNQYRQTVAELQDLSDRDLDDIGVARCDIRRIARQSVEIRRSDV